jgi:S-adenosylmethionine:tRNA ribosyltransferase-isomerase
MVVSRADPSCVEHRRVRDLPEVLREGDLLVVNTTRVLPARFTGVREDSGGRVQGLYLGPAPGAPEGHRPPKRADPQSRVSGTGKGERWGVLIKSRRQAPGVRIRLHDRAGRDSGIVLVLVERHPDEQGAWVAEVVGNDQTGVRTGAVLERIGLTPLPPYILQARKHRCVWVGDEVDRAAYQTVFAVEAGEGASHGSVAAPTAGLHFTAELFARLGEKGIRRAEVVLSVGTGTFKPVETEHVEEHAMHPEWCWLPAETGRAIRRARAEGGRVVAVGTTSARTIESFEACELELGGMRETRLLITPGYRWKHVDVLMTNFHLPRSTLMAMVAAFLGEDEGAVTRLKDLYAGAMKEGYRFYSYGDAMIVLP